MDFPFPCPTCGKNICRRAYTINLALGYSEEQYCLTCLSGKHDQDIESLYDFIYGYIQSRDCFKKEWVKMKEPSECPLPKSCVIEKCFPGLKNELENQGTGELENLL